MDSRQGARQWLSARYLSAHTAAERETLSECPWEGIDLPLTVDEAGSKAHSTHRLIFADQNGGKDKEVKLGTVMLHYAYYTTQNGSNYHNKKEVRRNESKIKVK